MMTWKWPRTNDSCSKTRRLSGAVRRRNLVNGIDHVDFVTTTPEAARAKQRLVEMARRKNGLTTQTNYLAPVGYFVF